MTIDIGDVLHKHFAAFRSRRSVSRPSGSTDQFVCLSGWSWLAPRSKTQMQMKLQATNSAPAEAWPPSRAEVVCRPCRRMCGKGALAPGAN